MSDSSKIDRLFPPKHFNDSSVNKIYTTKEKQIMVWQRNKVNTPKYKVFDEMVQLYLSKLPSNNVKKYVSNIANKDLIFIGSSKNAKTDFFFARVLWSNDKLHGIVMDSNMLDIDLETGDTSQIDDVVYAVYFGLIRAAVLTSQSEISHNTDLHQLLSTYIYFIILNALGRNAIYNQKQKSMIHMVCIYAYYRHFLKYNHAKALGVIKKLFGKIFSKDLQNEFLPMMKDISQYSRTNDIPNMLVDLRIYHDNPQRLTMSIIKNIQQVGYFSLVGPLDQLVPTIILSGYPTSLIPKRILVNDKIHKSIETIMLKYLNKVKYEKTALLNPKG